MLYFKRSIFLRFILLIFMAIGLTSCLEEKQGIMPAFMSLKESFNKAFNKVFYREAIVFLRDGNLWVMDSDGKNQRQLTKEGVEDCSVSRNGNVIFRKKGELFHLKPNGEIARVAVGLIDNAHYNISPDGTKVIFSKGEDTLLYDLKDKTQKKLAFVPFTQILNLKDKLSEDINWQWFNDTDFVWSSDSKMIAFRRCSGVKDMPFCSLFLQDVESNNPPILVGEEYASHGNYSAPYPIGFQNGRFFFSTPANIYVYETATGNYFFLIKEGGWAAKISPDGKMLAYLLSGNLWLMEIDNRNNKQLTRFQNMEDGHIQWFPDSNHIQFGIKPAERPWEYQTWEISRDGYSLKKIADSQVFPDSQYKTIIPRITFIPPTIAKTIILIAIALTGLLFLFGMVLITRKMVKAVISKIPKSKPVPKTKGIFCSQCGKENLATASFCTGCGQRLKE